MGMESVNDMQNYREAGTDLHSSTTQKVVEPSFRICVLHHLDWQSHQRERKPLMFHPLTAKDGAQTHQHEIGHQNIAGPGQRRLDPLAPWNWRARRQFLIEVFSRPGVFDHQIIG